MFKITALNVIAVYGVDLEKLMKFYTEILGFEKIQDLQPGILLQSGTVTLYVEAGRKRREDESIGFPEFAPCFETESVRQSYETLKAAGVKMVADYREYAPTFAMFKIADPDGNTIEFAGRP